MFVTEVSQDKSAFGEVSGIWPTAKSPFNTAFKFLSVAIEPKSPIWSLPVCPQLYLNLSLDKKESSGKKFSLLTTQPADKEEKSPNLVFAPKRDEPSLLVEAETKYLAS